jgi:hypothetical protein
MKKKTRIQGVRFTEAQWQTLRERAQSCGLPTSTYLRRVGLGAIPRQRPDIPEHRVVNQLARVGNNLNQIARKVNSGIPVPESEIREALARYLQIMERF